MSSSINAFPIPGLSHDEEFNGMTLRDYFAAKAMQGDWASQSIEVGQYGNNSTIEDLAFRAALFYRMADAMLEVRK